MTTPRALTYATAKATVVMPQVAIALARAEHGPREHSLRHVQQAKKLVRELLARIEDAELAAARESFKQVEIAGS